MRKLLFFLVLGSLLLLSTYALAQSGGGYDLTWSTVDGGGHMWSEGSRYALGGTLGQADAQALASGSRYSLQGGFWQRSCSPQAVAIGIECHNDQVQLSWKAEGANLAYDIYRATTPYVAPVLTAKQATVVDSSWIDPTAKTCGSPAANYYYVVRSTCVGGHADAEEVAEFDFGLTPGN